MVVARLTWRFNPGETPPPPPEVTPPSGDLIATAPSASMAWDNLGVTLSAALPVGQFVNGDVFAVSTAAASITAMSPAAEVYDQPLGPTIENGNETDGSPIDPLPAWINGAEINSGNHIYSNTATIGGNIVNESGVRVGLDSRRLTESPSMNPSPAYNYSGPADGVNGNPYPVGHPLAGQYRNCDPGFTGQPIAFAEGAEFSITKAWSRKRYTFRDRLQQVGVFTILKEVPAVGAFRPATAPGDKTIPLYLSDIDFTGLPSLPRPAGVIGNSLFGTSKPFIHSVTGSDGMRNLRGRWEAVPFDPENPTTTGGPRRVQEFGRGIGGAFTSAALAMLWDDTTSEVRTQLAVNICQAAIDLCGRVDEGGNFYPVATPGAHVQQWGPIVAVAAWLTRNSARGEYFRRFLTVETVSAFQGGLGQGKVVDQTELFRLRNILTNTEFRNLNNYNTLQLRPPALGVVCADANREAGYTRWPIGLTAYAHQHFNSIVGFALFLKLVGGEEFSPRWEWWNWMEQYADVVRWHDGASFMNEEGFRDGHRDSTGTPATKALWQFRTAPTNTAPVSGGAMSMNVRRETTAVNYVTVQEHWTWARFEGLLQRRLSTQIPSAAAFAVTVNGSPRAVDSSQLGHVAVRGENIGVALVGPALVPGDVVGLTYTPETGRELRFHDGALVPGFSQSVTVA